MGLIDLKTDLKSLRYGKDTIGGGYSGQPYIQTPIPESFNDLGADYDFILRGGINAVRDSLTDIKRLTKMFFDLKSPNGVLFIAKQNLLSQTAVRTQTSGVVNEGIYTPLNTLAEAGVVAFGGHLNKQGINPFTYTGAYANNNDLYYTRMINYNTEAILSPDGILKNRLVALQQTKILNVSIGGFDKTSNISSLPSEILSYSGGPGSKLGVGQTSIRFSSQRTGINNPLWNSYVNNISSWTAPQNARGFRANGVISFEDYKYNPLTTGISEKGGIYDELLGVGDREYENRDIDGNILQSNNVYKSGSLQPYTPVTEGQKIQTTVNIDNVKVGGLQVDTERPWTKSPLYELPTFTVNTPQNTSLTNIPIGPLTWTPQHPQALNPSGSNYILGTLNSINYGVTENTGVTRIVGDQPTFVNPNVYNPAVGFAPYLTDNTEKTLANGTITYTQEQFKDSDAAVRYNQTGRLIDFRKIIRNNISNRIDKTPYIQSGQLPTGDLNYSTQNIGDKNLLGNPGANRINKNYSSFSKGVSYKTGEEYKALDLINAEAVGDDLSNDDLVQFRIKSLFTGGSTLAFRAFLGGITDSYSSTLNSQQYVGRGENFYTYGGQTRKISLSWTVAALSRQELLPMYKRLSYLASMTAPKYENGFMQGPLVNLTVGGYIYNLPGYIEGFSLEMAEDSTWEIAMDENGQKDNTISQLTHVIKVNGFNFQPIPNYLPEVGARFISIVNPSGIQL